MKSLRLVLARAATQRMRRAQPPIATVLTEALGCRYGSRFISWPSSIVSIRPSQESIGVQRCPFEHRLLAASTTLANSIE
jgi:hypothetical protein